MQKNNPKEIVVSGQTQQDRGWNIKCPPRFSLMDVNGSEIING